MINITEANKAKWNASTESKSLVIRFPNDNITITNSDIVAESLTLEEALNEDPVLTFTGCIASRFSFEIADIVQDLRGHLVTAEISIGTQAAVPLFYGYVDTQDNLSHQDVVTRFECYDPMVSRVNASDVTEWYNALSFPLTVKAFRDALCTELGITQRTIILPNDGLYISTKTIDDEAISGGQLLRYICQLNGVFGHFDRYGYFEYKQLIPIQKGVYPSTDLYPSPDLYPSRENFNIDASAIYTAIKYEPFEVELITGVKIIDSYGTVGGSYGSPDNVLTISENPLAWAVNMSEAAENLGVQVEGMQFVPSDTALIGLPYMECGDAIFVNTYKNMVRSYILSRTLTGIQAITDEFRCRSDKKQPVYTESTETQISRNNDNIVENAAEIQRNYLYTDQLVANSVQAEAVRTNNLVAQKIQAEETRTNTLVANSIQVEALRTNQLVANSISASEVRTSNLITQKISAEETRTNTLVANSINTSEARTDRLLANKADVSDITAVNGRISNLNSELVNTNRVLAQKANITDLNAANARINNLAASSITTSYLYSNDITVKSLYAWNGNIQGSALIGSTVNCDRISMGGNTATWQSKTINGVTINYLGR